MRLFGVCCVLVASLAFTAGCSADDEGEDEGTGGASGVRSASFERAAGAFTAEYGLGILSARRFDDIPRRVLMEKLPEGDARSYAQCLESRRDVVKGNTLGGMTWEFEGERYYVLATELEDGNGLSDVRMLFVFSSDGVSRFQVLAWDGRNNLQVSFRQGSPCVDRVPAP